MKQFFQFKKLCLLIILLFLTLSPRMSGAATYEWIGGSGSWSDTANWNPRHRGGSHFLFTDAHVDWTKSERYFDPEGHEGGTRKYAKALDKDAFGNRPM